MRSTQLNFLPTLICFIVVGLFAAFLPYPGLGFILSPLALPQLHR